MSSPRSAAPDYEALGLVSIQTTFNLMDMLINETLEFLTPDRVESYRRKWNAPGLTKREIADKIVEHDLNILSRAPRFTCPKTAPSHEYYERGAASLHEPIQR